MNEDTSDVADEGTESTDARDAVESTAASSSYKVLGEFADPAGAGVLGRNTAGSGVTKGVEGQVDSPDGFGLYTPDDARVEGEVETSGAHRLLVDGDQMLYLGSKSSGAMGNVVGGQNLINSGVVGVTIGGGGYDDGTTQQLHVAHDDYATIGGGRNNEAGSADADPSTARFATVGGGHSNRAREAESTIGGGASNATNGTQATIGGGVGNAAESSATVAGGVGNAAGGGGASIGGGALNEAIADYATIAGGGPSDTTSGSTQQSTKNLVTDDYGTVGGGGDNRAGDATSGTTSATFATVGGGESNTAGASHSAVPGGRGNSAGGRYSFAAGRRANAAHDGSFVWGDGTDADVTSTGADQFIVRASGGVGVGTDSPATQLDVDGAVSRSACANVYLGTDQTVSHDTEEVVAFDSVEGDDFSGTSYGFDAANNEYVVPHDGNYQVMVNVEWVDGLPAGTRHRLTVRVNGADEARSIEDVPGDAGQPRLADSVNTVQMGLQPGDAFDATVYQDSGSVTDVFGWHSATYMAISHVG